MAIAITCCVSNAAMRNFTVTTMYPKDLNNLYLRGSGCGLSWSSGLNMSKVNKTSFSAELMCKDTENHLEMKVLRDDKGWMMGTNHVV